MKILRVEAVPLSIPCRHGAEGWTLGTGGWKALDFCLVRVDTDAGITGWGEAFSYSCRRAVTAAVNDMIAPLAVGRDAGDIEGLHAEIQRRLHIFGRFGITAFALSGLDIALWDIAGKAAGKPLHALLGGARRERLPCYASLLRYADEVLVARYCEKALGEGFPAIKLHEVNERVIAAARAAAPQPTALQLDVNCEWNVRDAIAVGRRLAPMGLEWFEEPVFPPEDGAGLRAVGEACRIPIAAGENCCFATQFAALFDAGAVQVAQPSVTKVGGVTEFRKVAALAAERGVALAPHSPYFGPGALATLHLLAALAEEARFEYFYLQADAWLYGDLLAPRSGELAVPRGPGLGADPDAEVVRRYRAD
ncbi:MAG TPA: mandelate racemase/muconate lactonizing enzyme family protein [Burkholderiales bacterium]|jgi:L-alanine-DL-glutamate epimerase-like enolase superfamily enzyme|nr:mandelate racemase/muconate lactonizing enzyme family protein [Burkholderiales bacterium]